MKHKTSGVGERSIKHFTLLVGLFIVCLAIIAARIFLIKVINGEEYTRSAMDRTRSSSEIPAKRGDIMDRNNVLLASSVLKYDLILDPYVMLTDTAEYIDVMPEVIEKCFDIPAGEIRDFVDQNPNSRYYILKTGLSYSDVKDFIEITRADYDTVREFLELPEDYEGSLALAGAYVEDRYSRYYTYGPFASSLLGFTQDGEGLYGIEKYYDDELAGTDGIKYSYLSDNNDVEYITRDALNGNMVQLTIDYNIQAIVEKYMMEMLDESGARTIAVTIQNPDTGEFYAMADSGIFDPNSPRDFTEVGSNYGTVDADGKVDAEVLYETWRNFCVSDSFEPGSTYKAFTVASALEEGVISEYDYFFCDGSVPVLDYTIHCANIDGHGEVSLTDALAESCNITMMDIAEREGIDLFCKYQSQFGFGNYTDIDLPVENSCSTLLYTRESMSEIDLATSSFGQSFNVTMVQMSCAFSSLINGGTYYKPYVLKGLYNASGNLIRQNGPVVVSKPVSSETCSFIKDALRHVVTDGTGPGAAVPGYITAGKTGTAQKGDREEDLWVASFIGFAPFDDPQVVCYVVIDEPADGGDGSSDYACRLFSNIMSEVLPYLNAVPAYMDYDPTGLGSPELPETTEEEEYTGDEEWEEENTEDDTGEEGEWSDEYYETDGYDQQEWSEEWNEDYYDENNW